MPDDDRPDPDDPHQELLCELHPLLNSTPYGITLSGKVTLTVPMIDSLVAWLTKASDTAEFLNSNSRR